MTIDLDACIGCNACTIACQAENNIPVVGAEEVARGREMHWIRVDRYDGRTAAPAAHLPAGARACIARTRRARSSARSARRCTTAKASTCRSTTAASARASARTTARTRSAASTSCSTSDDGTETLKALRNPDVTVRQRGVMEKCTYCVQRIVARAASSPRSRQRRSPTATSSPPASRPARPRRSTSATCATPASDVVAQQGVAAPLRAARRAQHAAAHHLPRAGRPRAERRPDRRDAAMTPKPRQRRSRSRSARPCSAPGWGYASIGDKIADIVLTRPPAGAGASPSGRHVLRHARLRRRDRLPVRARASASGASTIPVAWGFAIANCVWWIGIGHAGHLHLGGPAAAAPEVAHLDQPLRRGDDAVRGRDGRPLSAPAPRPALVLLLACALSRHDGPVAAMAQPAGVGLLRDRHLPHRLAAVLVPGPDPRPGDAARPRAGHAASAPRSAWSRSAGAARRATGRAIEPPTCCSPAWRRRSWSRCIRWSRSTSRSATRPATTRRSSRPTSSPARCSRASRWC